MNSKGFLWTISFIQKKLKKKGVEEVVIIDLVVEEDGSFSEIKFFNNKEYHFGFGEEAMRVINIMPKWEPGQVNGKNVRTRHVLPVRFSLDSTLDFDSIIHKQELEKYRYFSTDVIDDSTDGFEQTYKTYHIKLYQDGQYEMSLSETHSHKMFFNDKIGEWIYSDEILVTIISEGNYIENEQTLILMDKNKHVQIEYQSIYDRVAYPNKTKIRWIPIQTLPFLDNIHFFEDL